MLRHLPNVICLARIALTVPAVLAIERGEQGLALALFTVAAVSDGLDGYLAKRNGWTSDLGRFLDPLADKLLLVSVFLACAWNGLLPVWLAAAAIARDLMIGGGALAYASVPSAAIAMIAPIAGGSIWTLARMEGHEAKWCIALVDRKSTRLNSSHSSVSRMPSSA